MVTVQKQLSAEIQGTLSQCTFLGQGSFGKVCAARSRGSGCPVAGKHMVFDEPEDKQLQQDEQACYKAMREAGGHPNVLLPMKELLPAEGGEGYLIFEAGLMDLRAFQKSRAFNMEAGCAAVFTQDLCGGLHFTHNLDVIHRDLKPANCILFLASMRPGSLLLKLADFGYARQSVARPMQTRGFCAPWYRAPEICHSTVYHGGGQPRYTAAVDIWSLGCIFGEFAFGKALFPAQEVTGDTMLPLESNCLHFIEHIKKQETKPPTCQCKRVLFLRQPRLA